MHYKFLDSKDIDRVMVDGTIMVSSLEYFRGLEEAEWADIADALEGASELTIGENFVLRESSPNSRALTVPIWGAACLIPSQKCLVEARSIFLVRGSSTKFPTCLSFL